MDRRQNCRRGVDRRLDRHDPWARALDIQTGGGTYFAQHVGGGANVEIGEYFLDQIISGDSRDHDVEADRARAAGLDVVHCRNERLRLEFFDVGAIVYFLRMVVWTVPDFDVDRHRDRL